MQSQTGEIASDREVDQLFPQWLGQGAAAAQVAIEPFGGGCDLKIHRLVDAAQDMADAAREIGRGGKLRHQQRALVKVDEVVARRAHEAGTGIAVAMADMQRHPAAPGAVRVERSGNLGLKPRACQRSLDPLAFPAPNRFRRPVLDDAAAAGAEMTTGGRNAVRTG